MMEVYKKLPALHPVMLEMFNHIHCSGEIPALLRLIHMVPIPKPGKDPGNPQNRRPISLICTGMKILEQSIYNRIIHQIEPKLFSGQYAYRRSPSTEHHLTVLMDFTHRELLKKRFVYVVSYDIASAFDRVPHAQLMHALDAFRLDPIYQASHP